MHRCRFARERIVGVLTGHGAGATTAATSRRHGIGARRAPGSPGSWPRRPSTTSSRRTSAEQTHDARRAVDGGGPGAGRATAVGAAAVPAGGDRALDAAEPRPGRAGEGQLRRLLEPAAERTRSSAGGKSGDARNAAGWRPANLQGARRRKEGSRDRPHFDPTWLGSAPTSGRSGRTRDRNPDRKTDERRRMTTNEEGRNSLILRTEWTSVDLGEPEGRGLLISGVGVRVPGGSPARVTDSSRT